MDTSEVGPAAITKWDPELTERLMGLIRPVIKGWHRGEVRGFDYPEDEEVAAHVRGVMEQALDDLAAQRLFPVIG